MNAPHNLGRLGWEPTPARWKVAYGKFAFIDNGQDTPPTLVVIGVELDAGARVTLAIRDPHTGVWNDSRNSTSWPALDAMFGHHLWRAYLDGYGTAVRMELEANQ